MQFEEPVGDGLTIPPHGQVLWIILHLVILVVTVLSRGLIGEKLLSIHRVFLSLNLAVAARLLLSDLVLGLFKDFPQDGSQAQDPCLTARHTP